MGDLVSDLFRFPILVLALSIAFVACGTDDEGEAPGSPSVVAPTEVETPTVTAPEPTPKKSVVSAANIAGLGDDIPEDLPLYPAAYSGFRVEDTGSDVVVVMESGGGVAEVMDYYVDAVEENGWSLESENLLENSGEIVAWKGDRQMFVLTMTNGQETVVSVKIMAKKD